MRTGHWLIIVALLITSCGRIGYNPLAVAASGGGAGSNTTDGGLAGSRDAGSGGAGGAGDAVGGAGGAAVGGAGGAAVGGAGGAAVGGAGGAGGLMSVDSGNPPPPDSGQSGAGGGRPDAAPDSGSSVDAGPPPTCADGIKNQDETGVDCGGRSCAPCLCTFGAPQVLGNPNRLGTNVFAPALSVDGLTMFLSLIASGSNEQVAVTKRTDRGDTFALPTLLPSPVNTSVEGTPELSGDGLSLYFFSQGFGGTVDRDLYVATRASTAAQFNLVSPLTTINSSRRDDRPWVSPDELTIYFSSQRASSTDDLWRATRNARSDAFGTPVAVTELNSSGNDAGIFLTPDGLVAFFASDRLGGLGGVDIYRTTRANVSSPFSTPEVVTEVSSTADDFDPQLTADGQELFFASNRNSTNYRIWRSAVTCP